MSNPASPKKIPNKCFDMEYATQWRKERDFLTDRGIRPTFTKLTDYVIDGESFTVKTYKYKKTAALFNALANFYKQLEAEREWDDLCDAIEHVCNFKLPANATEADVRDAFQHLSVSSEEIAPEIQQAVIDIVTKGRM